MEKCKSPLETLFWSIALPGFGQFLNGKYFKGAVLLLLEFLVNVSSRFNTAILLSFNGKIGQAMEVLNYQWLMFYPCLYFFAMWDAWKDAGGGKEPYSFLPFVFSAYFVTVGLMFSSHSQAFGSILGPVFFPMLCTIPGIVMGLLIKRVLLKVTLNKNN